MAWEFFSQDELKCKCGECHSTGEEMNADFMAKIVLARRIYGQPIIVSSAYRCSAYNAKVANTGSMGEHTKGEAIDFLVSLGDAYRWVRICLQLDFLRIGLKQEGPLASRFVHIGGGVLDNDFPSPRIWTYP